MTQYFLWSQDDDINEFEIWTDDISERIQPDADRFSNGTPVLPVDVPLLPTPTDEETEDN